MGRRRRAEEAIVGGSAPSPVIEVAEGPELLRRCAASRRCRRGAASSSGWRLFVDQMELLHRTMVSPTYIRHDWCLQSLIARFRVWHCAHGVVGGQFCPQDFTRLKLGFLPDKLGVFGVWFLPDKLGAKCLIVGHYDAIIGLLDV